MHKIVFPPPEPEFITARWSGGHQVPSLIVMHSAVVPCREGSARAVADGFARGDRVASAHYSVDPGEVIQSVNDHTVAFHCGYNDGSIAVEMCELPSLKVARWASLRFRGSNRRRMFNRSAELVARLCLAYDIPPRFVAAGGTSLHTLGSWASYKKPERGGITTHAAMTKAFHRSTHWDPGAWPRFRFIRRVRRHMRRLAVEAQGVR